MQKQELVPLCGKADLYCDCHDSPPASYLGSSFWQRFASGLYWANNVSTSLCSLLFPICHLFSSTSIHCLWCHLLTSTACASFKKWCIILKHSAGLLPVGSVWAHETLFSISDMTAISGTNEVTQNILYPRGSIAEGRMHRWPREQTLTSEKVAYKNQTTWTKQLLWRWNTATAESNRTIHWSLNGWRKQMWFHFPCFVFSSLDFA